MSSGQCINIKEASLKAAERAGWQEAENRPLLSGYQKPEKKVKKSPQRRIKFEVVEDSNPLIYLDIYY